MAIYTNAEKAEALAQWKAALAACSSGQEYTIGQRRLRRADLPEIRSTLAWLNGLSTVEDEASGRGGLQFIPCIPGRR